MLHMSISSKVAQLGSGLYDESSPEFAWLSLSELGWVPSAVSKTHQHSLCFPY